MACLTRAGTWLSYLFSRSWASPRGSMEVRITTDKERNTDAGALLVSC